MFKIADNEDAASYVAHVLTSNFDKLPENVRNELLLKLADHRLSARYVLPSAVASNFDKLPENVRNELLLKLADKLHAPVVSHSIANNLDKLPENARNELLLKLAHDINKDGDVPVASIVANNFDKLPKNVRSELLVKLADNKEAAWHVAFYKSLPGDVKYNLLRELKPRNVDAH